MQLWLTLPLRPSGTARLTASPPTAAGTALQVWLASYCSTPVAVKLSTQASLGGLRQLPASACAAARRRSGGHTKRWMHCMPLLRALHKTLLRNSPPPLAQVRHSSLSASLQQQAALRGLRNEASLMATLNHPNSETPLGLPASAQTAAPCPGGQQARCGCALAARLGCARPHPPAAFPPPSCAVCRYLGACIDPPLIVME